VALLVQNNPAHLALVSLLAKPPDKVFAVAAERGLTEETRNKLVPVDLSHA
jgi:hypothetical protein